MDFLFPHRAKRLTNTCINTAVVPSLCRKASVPTADVRGNVTRRRARSTIASQLYNAKGLMTLFELQAWLGNRSPEATQHYAKITPEHAGQGLQRCRVLRAQRLDHRGPGQPRCGYLWSGHRQEGHGTREPHVEHRRRST
ncbi:hypothetical protein [Streptomyces sp. NPDC098781]|uniref:hypothetical protein n=1 Tax=Streptomyces sp. NPDC098781 TaxID=3366097 RepID=UPI0038301CBE